MRTTLIKTLPLLAAGLLLTGCGSSELKPSSLDDGITTWKDLPATNAPGRAANR